jgi:hypothetical protein
MLRHDRSRATQRPTGLKPEAPGANCIEAVDAILQVAEGSDFVAIEVDFIGGVEAYLQSRLSNVSQGIEVGMTADPEMRLGNVRMPL